MIGIDLETFFGWLARPHICRFGLHAWSEWHDGMRWCYACKCRQEKSEPQPLAPAPVGADEEHSRAA
ncbi:MAG: hypothetical protein CMI63_00490 [Parvularcula sp.]|nr:hypothetical protein [Parvularcula sp.]